MGRVLASNIGGYLQRKVAREQDEVVDRFLVKYQARLANDLNRVAAMKLAEAALPGTLTFTVTMQADRRTMVVTPSDRALFSKLEFGEFDEAGNLRSPPHSVISEFRVTVRP
jgi:hypothetical protein